MALLKCPECGRDVSSEADVCIHCGYPLKKNRTKENQISKEVINGEYVVGYRGGPGGVLAIYIVGFVLGLAFVIPSIIVMIIFKYWFFAIYLVLGAILVILPLIEFVGIIINATNKKPCISYNSSTKKLTLCTAGGKEIIIDPHDYVELRDNFATSNILKFTYRLPNGRLKKVSLGYCTNRSELRKRMDKVLEQ